MRIEILYHTSYNGDEICMKGEMNMRILMLSANIGEGHNSSAKAVMDVMRSRGVECELLDCLAFLSPSFSKFVSDWHTRLYRYGGGIFDAGYRFCENTARPDGFNLLYELLSLGAGKLRDLIKEKGYSAIACVHPFAGIMVTEVRKNWGLELPTFLIATDYTFTPTVEQCKMDTFFVPAQELSKDFAAMGISKEHQHVCGIPVRMEYYEKADQAQVRQKLHLPEDATVVLVMCGSMGCGPIQKIAAETLEQMPDNAVMVAICGRNKKLQEEMEKMEDRRLRVLGYIQNFSEYLDAADLIITKPGGLSSTEAANKHVPMVFINAVGGCENRNFDHFVKKGYAIGSKDPAAVVRHAIRMTWDKAGREKMKTTLQRDFYNNTTLEITDFIMSATKARRKKRIKLKSGE